MKESAGAAYFVARLRITILIFKIHCVNDFFDLPNIDYFLWRARYA